jgi:hypothetical protein
MKLGDYDRLEKAGKETRIAIICYGQGPHFLPSRFRNEVVTPLKELLATGGIDAVILITPVNPLCPKAECFEMVSKMEERGLAPVSSTTDAILRLIAEDRHPHLEWVFPYTDDESTNSEELVAFARNWAFPRATVVLTVALGEPIPASTALVLA